MLCRPLCSVWFTSLWILISHISCSNESEKKDGALAILAPEKTITGEAIYAEKCQGCHAPLKSSNKIGATIDDIKAALAGVPQMASIKLSDEDLSLISQALAPALNFVDGPGLYNRLCVKCHDTIEKSTKKDRTSEQIYMASRSVAEMKAHPKVGRLSKEETAAISLALSEEHRPMPKAMSLNRIDDIYFINMLSDVFSGVVDVQEIQKSFDRLPAEDTSSGYRNKNFSLSFDRLMLYQEVGNLIADRFKQDPMTLAFLGNSCASEVEVSQECRQDFTYKLFQIFFRVNPNIEDINSLLKNFDGPDFSKVAGSLIKYFFMSPDFIFDLHLKKNSDLSFKVAHLLSKAIWQSVPDQKLIEKAKSQEILHNSVLISEIKRMLADQKFSRSLNTFVRDVYLNGSQSDKILEEASIREIAWLISNAMSTNQDFIYLFNTQDSWLDNSDLARIYGYKDNKYPTQAKLSGARGGLLTRYLLLAQAAPSYNPIRRGAFLRHRILCDPLRRPKPEELGDANFEIPPANEEMSTRQAWEIKTGAPECMTCHHLINPLGFIMGNYDQNGSFISEEKIYDSKKSNQIIATHDILTEDIPLIGFDSTSSASSAKDLAKIINDQGWGSRCFLIHWWKDRLDFIDNFQSLVEKNDQKKVSAAIQNAIAQAISYYKFGEKNID